MLISYFAAMALVRLLHFPQDDPWNRLYMALYHWGWSASDWAALLLGAFVALYLLARLRRRDRPRVLFAVDDDEPLFVLPQTARWTERSELRRATPGPIDYVRAALFALPRLTRDRLAELAHFNRLRRTDVKECARVVQALYGRGNVELKQLCDQVGRETLELALPQLWELPFVRFEQEDPQKLALGRIAEQDLVVFGVA
jgi:hypothetical protein